jgi:hypothetical protein
VRKVTKVSTKGQTMSVMTEVDAPTQDMQIQQTPPQHSSIVLRAGGACTTSQWAMEGASERACEKAKMGRGEELNRRHSLLLVLDVRRHPSLDEDGFKQMNKL